MARCLSPELGSLPEKIRKKSKELWVNEKMKRKEKVQKQVQDKPAGTRLREKAREAP